MSDLNVYIHPNFSLKLTAILHEIHQLQREKNIRVVKWQNLDEEQIDLNNSVFLMTDAQSKGLSVSTLKHSESGYRIFACKLPKEKLDIFELAMSVLRVWPYIIEKSMLDQDKFLYTFNYKGRKLSNFKLRKGGKISN